MRQSEVTADHLRKRLFLTPVTDDIEVRRRPIKIEQRKRLRGAIRAEDMGVAAGDNDEIAAGHTESSAILEHDDGRTPAEIVEDCVREFGQRQTPGTAKLVVEQQGPAQADAVEHIGKDVHSRKPLQWTVGHKLRTIIAYRPCLGHPTCWSRQRPPSSKRRTVTIWRKCARWCGTRPRRSSSPRQRRQRRATGPGSGAPMSSCSTSPR